MLVAAHGIFDVLTRDEPWPWRAASQPLVHRGSPEGNSNSKFKKPVNRDRTGLRVSFREEGGETLPAAGLGEEVSPRRPSPVITAPPRPPALPETLLPCPCVPPSSPTPRPLKSFPASHPPIHVAAPQHDPCSCPTTSPLAGPGLSPQCPPARPGPPVLCPVRPSTAPGPQPALGRHEGQPLVPNTASPSLGSLGTYTLHPSSLQIAQLISQSLFISLNYI